MRPVRIFVIASILTAVLLPCAWPASHGGSAVANPAEAVFSSLPRSAPKKSASAARHGRVRVEGNSLVDDEGPFPGLGVSYFTALWRCKHDPARLERDLAFLAANKFNYFRVLSMVGYYPAWDGLEIAPVAFTNKVGKKVEAWPDYRDQLVRLVDIAFDKHGLRTHITIFADAQLMPERRTRLAHMNMLLHEVVPGREHKIMLLEVANEAWQNGFPGAEGVEQLREFSAFLNNRTTIPVAITSHHEDGDGFERLYRDNVSDLATWHFSRDIRTHEGWAPVYDCWRFANRLGFPPVISNEPIGPGASVNTERKPIRLVSAAAFAYVAGLPGYVFHSEAGVFGKSSFEQTPAIGNFALLLSLLPPDLPSWTRNDGKEPAAPFTVFAAGQPDRYWSDVARAGDGCLMFPGARKGKLFVCFPIGIRKEGLQLQARADLEFVARDPMTGHVVVERTLSKGEQMTLPPGPGALLLLGNVH